MLASRRFAATMLLCLPLSFPMPASGAEHEDHDYKAAAGAITVVHAWARAAHQGEACLVFFEIGNEGESDRLLGAESELASSIGIVGIVLSGDKVSYQPIEEIDIPAGTLSFDPKGLGLLLGDLSQDLVQGEEFELELVFEKAGHLHIHVEVQAENASQHNHAGHSH